MRLFTAIPLPKETKDQIFELTRNRLPVPYVNTTNLHITLNFFGELTDAEIEKVRQIFLETAKNQKSFLVEFDAVKKFHQQIHMTVRPNPELSELQSKFEKAFAVSGFQFQDRNYYPHVKLANLHMDKVMHSERKMENFPNELLEDLKFTADKVALFESKLLLHHAKHTLLLEQRLA